jgi:hypothetical protein
MKKESRTIVSALFVVASALLLASCNSSGAGTSASHVSIAFDVRFFDDAGVEIGYNYVAPGGKAFTYTEEAYPDKSVFDKKVSRAGGVKNTGGHMVFQYWGEKGSTAAVPADMTAALANVTQNLDVQAYFKEIPYTYNADFFGDDNRKISGASLTPDYGVVPSFPASQESYQQFDYTQTDSEKDGRWGYDFTSNGFYLGADKAKTPFQQNAIAFVSGEGAPSAVAALGTIYADVAAKDSINVNSTYPLYFSNGTEWISLGKLADDLTFSFYASYLMTPHPFTVSFYPSVLDATNRTNVFGSFKVPYGGTFLFDTSLPTTKAVHGTDTVTLDTHTSWTGINVNCTQFNDNLGKKVDSLNTVVSDCVFYPA